MTTLNVNTIEPAGATLTIGADGDSVVLADDVKSNTYKDAGGNTLFVSNGSGVLSSVNSGFYDALKLISTQTASNSASISFTSGITSAYKEYIFKYINIHPATDDVHLQFQVSTDGGSSYGVAKTSTYFYAYNEEAGGASSGVSYQASRDLAQSTSAQQIASLIGNDADASASGEFHLFNPASTTYVKHFYGTSNSYEISTAYSINNFVGGYVNSTSAINAIQFTMSSGNMDAGTIKMYGVA